MPNYINKLETRNSKKAWQILTILNEMTRIGRAMTEEVTTMPLEMRHPKA